MPTGINPSGGIIGDIGIRIVALAAGLGALWAGLHRVGREEATQVRIQIARPQVQQRGGRGVESAAVVARTANNTLRLIGG